MRRLVLVLASVAGALSAPVWAQSSGAPAQPAAAATPAAPAVPEDLAAYCAEVARRLAAEPQQGRRMLMMAAREVASRQLTGENQAFGALLLARGSQHEKALAVARAYLDGRPQRTELGLAALIDAASWKVETAPVAREAYARFAAEFGTSATADPLRQGAPLRLAVEEAMARVAIIDGEDSPAAARHYGRALEIVEAMPPATIPLEDHFRLRWYLADAISSTGDRIRAQQLLEATRTLVAGDQRLSLQLEDFILFKVVAGLLDEQKYAEARALLERRLPEFAPSPVNARRIGKLLDRVKLVGAPAPALAREARWIGGGPLTLEGLRGKVVLLEFFTSG